ncbi:MAG: glutamine--tRNA ligase/YqeY domain fusion protein [Pseudomonadota bacterium]
MSSTVEDESKRGRDPADSSEPRDFIRARIVEDLEQNTVATVVTRFPPEPNGYLHIGHAKSICLNFGVAAEHGGQTYLRFDDTNPVKEDQSFVDAITADVAWLGFDWGDRLTHASDYFDQLYEFALELIRTGKAYVDSQSMEQIRETRGTLTEPGSDSPYRDRTVEENLDLFTRMRAGEFEDGAHVLRAKIDMQSPNVNLRDPVLYRIRKVSHQRTGDRWPIYPMYDYTHCICDALEGITHSLCTLEFEDHRPLYDWVLDQISTNWHPPQIEFSRLGLEYTVMSKRLLHRLVAEAHVAGWDDPRMPTIAGLRRRGVTPAAIREFCRRIGVTKQNNTVEMQMLEFCIRQDLDRTAPRAMAVLDPLPVTLTNYPEGQLETIVAPWHPQQPELGEKDVVFGGELFIERDDFALEPPPKWKRLTVGGLVRLRNGYIIRCVEAERSPDGEVQNLRCEYVENSRSGADESGLKPKGVIHWVAAARAVAIEVRDYEPLFTDPAPTAGNFTEVLREDSVRVRRGLLEPAAAESGEPRFQFERIGYYARDPDDRGLFHRTVSLRDSWKPK